MSLNDELNDISNVFLDLQVEAVPALAPIISICLLLQIKSNQFYNEHVEKLTVQTLTFKIGNENASAH